MKEKEINNKPLMFIDTVQKVENKNTSQQVYDSRYNNKKQKKD